MPIPAEALDFGALEINHCDELKHTACGADDHCIRVLVTGASGFIAGHVIIQLLQAGYCVRGTLRDLKLKQTVLDLANLVPDAQYPMIEIFECDLLFDAGWSKAVQDCTYVIHIASPFLIEIPKDEREFVEPAVEGTLRVLRAVAATHGKVKRVVLTSSIASVITGHPDDVYAAKVFTEADWSVPTACAPYAKSKTLAEKAAWNFVSSVPDGDNFELSVILPGYVQGPKLNSKPCASQLLVQRFLAGTMPGCPAVCMGYVDVRDIALAHIRAMTTPNAAGQRYICTSTSLWMHDVAMILKAEFPQYPITTFRIPNWVLKIVQLWDPNARAIISDLGKTRIVDSSKAERDLGITFRPARQAVLDMAYSLIQLGIIPKKNTKEVIEKTHPTALIASTTEQQHPAVKNEENKAPAPATAVPACMANML